MAWAEGSITRREFQSVTSKIPVADGDLPDDDPHVTSAMGALTDNDPEVVAGMERLNELRALENAVRDLPRSRRQS